jgi:hypothetical protein
VLACSNLSEGGYSIMTTNRAEASKPCAANRSGRHSQLRYASRSRFTKSDPAKMIRS